MSEPFVIGNSDFKYIIQDVSKIYMGAQYTYEEVLQNEDVSFRFRGAVIRYIVPNVAKDMTIAAHFHDMRTSDDAYLLYKQLRCKVKVNVPQGNEYRSLVIPIFDFLSKEYEWKQQRQYVMEEIQISKLAMLSV